MRRRKGITRQPPRLRSANLTFFLPILFCSLVRNEQRWERGFTDSVLHIQKEILGMMAFNVQKAIRDEIGDAKFCLIVDESRDESRREQMVLVRFVDQEGFIRERFLDVVHVHDTTSATLKQELCSVLSKHKLDVQNIRGQGYDGASNMRGEWNGLQAKFVAVCPYAYYVHCFAHQLLRRRNVHFQP